MQQRISSVVLGTKFEMEKERKGLEQQRKV